MAFLCNSQERNNDKATKLHNLNVCFVLNSFVMDTILKPNMNNLSEVWRSPHHCLLLLLLFFNIIYSVANTPVKDEDELIVSILY